MGKRNFVVTGCGRSGTTYTADVITQAGHPCGHEQIFNPYFRRFRGFGELEGDSSWLAAPFLDQLPRDVLVIHQVRDPRKVMGSHVGIRAFDTTFRLRSVWRALKRQAVQVRRTRRITRTNFERRPFLTFVKRHCPEVFEEPTSLERAARYWVAWNSMIEDTTRDLGLDYVRFRIEDADAALADLVLPRLGDEHQPLLERALDSVPTTRNRRRIGPDVSYADLPEPLRGQVIAMAERYGYQVAHQPEHQ